MSLTFSVFSVELYHILPRIPADFQSVEVFRTLSVFLLLLLRISLVSPSSRLRTKLGLVSRMAGSYKEATRKLHGKPARLAIEWVLPEGGANSYKDVIKKCARRSFYIALLIFIGFCGFEGITRNYLIIKI